MRLIMLFEYSAPILEAPWYIKLSKYNVLTYDACTDDGHVYEG
jgi:hypothetical protein